MEDFNQKQVVDETAQAMANNCSTDGNNLPQAGKNMDQDVDGGKMTTEEFHRLLEENTELMNHARELCEERKIQAQRELDLQRDSAQSTLDSIQKEKDEFEQVITEKKIDWGMRERNIRDFRRKAHEDFTRAITKAKNERATTINMLQSARNLIFARYKNSGEYSSEIMKNCFIQSGSARVNHAVIEEE